MSSFVARATAACILLAMALNAAAKPLDTREMIQVPAGTSETWEWDVALSSPPIFPLANGSSLICLRSEWPVLRCNVCAPSLIIAAKDFEVGADFNNARDGEAPPRKASVRPVSCHELSTNTVNNSAFRAFVRATKYTTEAEQYGWSFVFHLLASDSVRAEVTETIKGSEWWLPVPRAYWRMPFGKGSSIKGRNDYPVTQISWNDARAFCKWRGMRLPTEAEWELAAGGSKQSKRYPWGPRAGLDHMNVWQGKFPDVNTKADGHLGLAPVDAYGPQTDTGFYNLLGNGWEWVDQVYEGQPGEPPSQEKRVVLKGGSYVDSVDGQTNHPVRVTTRMGNTVDSASDNMSFRCAVSAAAAHDEL
ncbi:uncharacterized protein MONBRDRAFT_10211 [Monosiga brevicollis MX1]|uniref:Sulfatase-modifying factor enzyme-like domain-containing protein n=1 Tax=Monosiga brevicollis TaxID=81824 RepID=A9V5J3_MONBE|nr:uncharacterized protein MONBRDRAFT_10211 [Monosiga brevicollis MX1]EDQ87380.1 predicted protein [Monosiga brevicollis MX1]|eukprot:XP_001747993.1 hypothetical protein [Monosiga brevicollis MX1]